MIPDYFIITFQLIASLLMGYDYFFSKIVVKKINEETDKLLNQAKKASDANIQKQKEQKGKGKPYLYLGCISTCIFIVSALIINIISKHCFPGKFTVVIFVSICVVGVISAGWAIRATLTYWGLYIIPITGSRLLNMLLTYLGHSPEKVVAAIGMFLLIVSFAMQYINVFLRVKP